MVITDCYLAGERAPAAARLPGLEHIARFGERAGLADGWRAYLARRVGCGALATAAPAAVAAAVLGREWGRRPGSWLASPVHLSASHSRVHLDHRGLLRLGAAVQARLCRGFAETFRGAGLALAALPSGGFLLEAPQLPALASADPERCAGGEIAAALPQGQPAAGLRRLWAEIEMWLHAQPLAGEGAPNALWLWGAGAPLAPALSLAGGPWRAWGADPYVDGLWRLRGEATQPQPAQLQDLLRSPGPAGAVLVLRVADELQQPPARSFEAALASLDARYCVPAVAALRAGSVDAVSLVANDAAFTVQRRSALKRWRRPRAGLGALA